MDILGFLPGKAVKLNYDLMQEILIFDAVLGIVAKVHFFVKIKFKNANGKMNRKSGNLKSVGLQV
jgi:hypothetical protein